MEYRNLGKSGLQVSVIGVGGNNFGGRVDAEGTKAVVNKAVELGVTLFDTADVYGALWGGRRGLSEEFLGAALKPHRRNVVIATKSNGPMGDGPYWVGSSRRYIMDALEACLRRLDTDYIDVYMMHRWDPRTPMDETLRAMDDMVRSGKVRYIGCSQYTGWQLVESQWVSKVGDLEKYVCALWEYNMLARGVQADLLPVCDRYGVSLIPLFPLANGFLTGKYRPGQPAPEGSRLSGPTPWVGEMLTEENFAVLTRLEAFANKIGHSMLEVAIGWLLSHPAIPTIIAGATRPDQIESNVNASTLRFNAEQMAEIHTILNS